METKTKGLLAAGGAMAVGYLLLSGITGDEGAGGAKQVKERVGRVLGTQAVSGSGEVGTSGAGTVYNIPAQAAVTFPEVGAGFDWSKIFGEPPTEETGLVGTTPGVTPEEEVTPKKVISEPWYKYIAGTGLGWTPAAGQAAFERGQRQEAEAAAYLAGHPTLKMREGVIVKKKPAVVTPSQLTPAQRKAAGIASELQTYYSRQAAGRWMVDPMKVMRIKSGATYKPSVTTTAKPTDYGTPTYWTKKIAVKQEAIRAGKTYEPVSQQAGIISLRQRLAKESAVKSKKGAAVTK